jgi:hypothetical protein
MRLAPVLSCLTVDALSELDSNPLVMAQKDATSNVSGWFWQTDFARTFRYGTVSVAML